ncbi:MAG: hypothetical protein LUC83_03830 [Clostridiales bacterium]|nr:hypothetical protein [Clostridiales bacterium]
MMKSKKMIAVTIYTVSIMQMSALAVSAAMSDISAQFPDASTTNGTDDYAAARLSVFWPRRFF